MRIMPRGVNTFLMNNRLLWLGILIVLAVTIVTVANCRKLPDPWEPQVETKEAPPSR